ncbi:hypothetical protein ABGB17_11355 [Sphaerisporangium sp. B11E5]|uniref:hypothetical protein n=1 Tax=Sphaerisporangium sp. B11E5 TaxID=3153563 RepID=UPI00325C8938
MRLRKTLMACGAVSVLAGVVGHAGPAAGHTAQSVISRPPGGAVLTFEGTAGPDGVEVEVAGGEVVVTVAGAAAAGPGCVAAPGPGHRFVCGVAGPQVEIMFTLGRGDDLVHFTGISPHGFVIGEAGADRLKLSDGGAAAHAVGFSGGSGRDLVDYSLATAPVDVSLDGADGDGRAGVDDDDIGTDVEDVWGSASGDRIEGSPQANDLRGGAGGDLLYGLGGDDDLHAAGAGHAEAPGARDVLDCGEGTGDTGRRDDRQDLLIGCENGRG